MEDRGPVFARGDPEFLPTRRDEVRRQSEAERMGYVHYREAEGDARRLRTSPFQLAPPLVQDSPCALLSQTVEASGKGWARAASDPASPFAAPVAPLLAAWVLADPAHAIKPELPPEWQPVFVDLPVPTRNRQNPWRMLDPQPRAGECDSPCRPCSAPDGCARRAPALPATPRTGAEAHPPRASSPPVRQPRASGRGR